MSANSWNILKLRMTYKQVQKSYDTYLSVAGNTWKVSGMTLQLNVNCT